MNKTNHVLTGLHANAEKQKVERLQRIDTIAKTVLVNYPKGFTVKEAAYDTKLPPYTIRQYLKTLVEEGCCLEIGKDGKSVIYILSDFLNDKQEEAAKEEVAKIEEAAKEEPQKVCAGREFKDSRSVTSVVAGDISWISSRSGNGLFFRYLILIVHSYKATCVNVFPEGHEAVNINDPNFIFVGTDPESGEDLYADLTNVCQRRFSAFGERCMHISPEHMENVKNRMARLLKVDIHPVGDQGTVAKLKKELTAAKDQAEKYRQAAANIEVDFNDYKLNRQNYIEGLHQQFKGIIHEKKETDKAKDELQARLDKLLELYEKSRKAYFDLEEKYNALQAEYQKEADKVPEDQPAEDLETEDLDRNTDLYIAIATLRTENDSLERMLADYRMIIDRLLDKA